MDITTRTQGFELTDAINQFVTEQVESMLHRIDEDIVAVDVFVKDANGPKGGVDKQALIRVSLRNRQVIALETTHENVYAAIKNGLKRTKRAVRRHLKKSQEIQKQRICDQLDPTINA